MHVRCCNCRKGSRLDRKVGRTHSMYSLRVFGTESSIEDLLWLISVYAFQVCRNNFNTYCLRSLMSRFTRAAEASTAQATHIHDNLQVQLVITKNEEGHDSYHLCRLSKADTCSPSLHQILIGFIFCPCRPKGPLSHIILAPQRLGEVDIGIC